MKITFVGAASCTPEPGRESACALIGDRALVDAGWNAVFRLRELGVDPVGLDTVFLTHTHMDHYLGLAGIFFYLGLRRLDASEPRRLTVVGPVEFVEDTVERTVRFLQHDRYPELKLDLRVNALAPGDGFENDELAVQSFPLSHTTDLRTGKRFVQSLAYRFVEKATGHAFVTAWDTSFCPEVADFAAGEELLIHDAAHTSPREAAETGKRADVEKLYLIHYTAGRADAALADAREVFERTFLAADGETLELRRSSAAET